MRSALPALLASLVLCGVATAAEPTSTVSGAFEGAGLAEKVVELFVAVTVLSIAPGLAMTVTCLPFMLIVFSILRQGIGLQQAPPNMLIVSVAMFLTWYVMEPVFREAWSSGIAPYREGSMNEVEAIGAALAPFRGFMQARVAEGALETLADARPALAAFESDSPPMGLLVPAFVLSEIQSAFRIGFVLLLPFLVIDLVVASILTAMGMMMVPPAIVSLPFKVAFFVLTNGWVLVSAALVRGYA